jgi:hypothetical protein
MITIPGGKKVFADSTGKPIHIGDRLRFRGKEYTLKAFGPLENHFGVATFVFKEPVHTEEIPNEISVDKI